MVGKKIKELRLSRKMTQEELGKIIGVTTSMIGMYETGARNPSYTVLKKIAEYFNVTTDYLLGHEEIKDVEIGANIKKYRKQAGLTQQELADKANISRSYLADVENGRYNPSLETLNSIAKVLNIKVSDILNGDTDKEIQFKTPQEAMRFILGQPSIMGFGGFDINKMSDEEIIDFANELLRQLELISYKYKK
ncbi:helix-turn-helix domain-containing protein [Calorimonas adulescens]|uniref:Helix-turn-helix domain-containing protein n=1 Tax=Calorimonas adulescens TaxID=2606906 RepID=A0A5D8QC57_9THEO|nr:helix-turn-helix transcriptional regulator [Calorimonas adulescens]TZE81977.1 helix-turn-helix domain-containing protein [Calorimonas adulescens]